MNRALNAAAGNKIPAARYLTDGSPAGLRIFAPGGFFLSARHTLTAVFTGLRFVIRLAAGARRLLLSG